MKNNLTKKIFVILLFVLGILIINLIFWSNSIFLYDILNNKEINNIIYTRTENPDITNDFKNENKENFNLNDFKKKYFIDRSVYGPDNYMQKKSIANITDCLKYINEISKNVKIKILNQDKIDNINIKYLNSIEFYNNNKLINYILISDNNFIIVNDHYYYASYKISNLWGEACLK